jgi:hypothetical protein
MTVALAVRMREKGQASRLTSTHTRYTVPFAGINTQYYLTSQRGSVSRLGLTFEETSEPAQSIARPTHTSAAIRAGGRHASFRETGEDLWRVYWICMMSGRFSAGGRELPPGGSL